MPGQDQVLGGMNSLGLPHNVIRGAQQIIDMNHGMDGDQGEGEGEGEDSPERLALGGPSIRDQEWA